MIFQETKSKLNEVKKSRKATGGGPPVADVDEIHQRVYELVPTQFERIENDFDNDADLNRGIKYYFNSGVEMRKKIGGGG